MSHGPTDRQVRTLLSGLYELANGMLPVREQSYEAGQRQGLLDVAEQITRIIRENGNLLRVGKKGHAGALPQV